MAERDIEALFNDPWPGYTTVTLTVVVPVENADIVVDALNEELNTLARGSVLDDHRDDAWRWWRGD